MASSNFNTSLDKLFIHEGGYSNHPNDPGGATHFGITINVYRKHVKPNATMADIRTMTRDEAKTIYRDKYWNVLRCDSLPNGIDYVVFDYGVNSGVGRSGRVLRRVLSFPDDNCIVTDEVIKAVQKSDVSTIIAAICDERLRFLRSLKTWSVFGKGWSRRVTDVKAAALAMAINVMPLSA